MKSVYLGCLYLMFLSLLFTFVKLEASDKDLVYGGEVVPDDEFYPFLVSLESETQCGGTILNERYILAAAHCHQGSTITIRAGSNYKDVCDHADCQAIEMYSGYQHHPNLYGECLHFDFKLLPIPNGKELKFNSRVDSAVIEKGYGPKYGSEIVSVGWGLYGQDRQFSKVLLKTTETVEDIENCPYKESQKKCAATYISGQFCASSNTSITCQGDSGGPLFYKSTKIVTGVVSTSNFGTERTCSNQAGQKSIYGSIGQVRKWIIEESRQNYFFGWGYSANLFWNNFAFSNRISKLIPSIGVMPIIRQVKPAYGPFVLAISVSDYAYSWGKGSNFELGYGDANDVLHPDVNIRLNLKDVKDVCGGISHSLALTAKGEVYEWGTYSGQPSITSPSLVKFPDNVVIASISCGYHHNLVVSTTNQIYFWGSNENGEGGNIENCEPDSSRFNPTPILIQSLSEKKIYSICARKSTSFAVTTDGLLYSWGKSNEGNLGASYKSSCVGKPEKLSLEEKATIVYCGVESHFVKAGKEVYGWGKNINHIISDRDTEFVDTPEKTDIGEIEQMTSGDDFIIFRGVNMKWYGRGNNIYGQLGINSSANIEKQVEIDFLNKCGPKMTVNCRNYVCFAADATRTNAFLSTVMFVMIFFLII